MRKILSLSLAVCATILTFALFAAPAQAQASRTWVSGVGDDANPCSRTAPCKTFAGAISKTATNGEINCIDPGGFGAVTIVKSITIDCHEVFGSILNAATNGIIINTTDTRATVNIRNLNIQGFDSGLVGIKILNAVNVNIEDCLIDGQFGSGAGGIVDGRGTAGNLVILNTTVRNIGGIGISIASTSGVVRAVLEGVKVTNAGYGLLTGSSATVAANRSVFSNNSTAGVFAANPSEIDIDNSSITGNAIGLQGLGTLKVSNSIIVNNATGVAGVVSSYTNNRFSGNGAGGTINQLTPTNTNPSGQQ
jgi:parallel beta helix pectate lyase-like protein